MGNLPNYIKVETPKLILLVKVLAKYTNHKLRRFDLYITNLVGKTPCLCIMYVMDGHSDNKYYCFRELLFN